MPEGGPRPTSFANPTPGPLRPLRHPQPPRPVPRPVLFWSTEEKARRRVLAAHLLRVQLGEVAERHGERLGVVLLRARVRRLQAVHAQQHLGLLQRHGAGEGEAPVSGCQAAPPTPGRTLL